MMQWKYGTREDEATASSGFLELCKNSTNKDLSDASLEAVTSP